MTTEEQLQRLTGIVESLAASVVAHDDQLGALIKSGLEQKRRIDELNHAIDGLREIVAQTERQWQAYINTLPRH